MKKVPTKRAVTFEEPKYLEFERTDGSAEARDLEKPGFPAHKA